MQVVAYPYVNETFERALHEVLSAHFRNGGTLTIGGQDLEVYRVNLAYQVHQVKVKSDRPRLAFIGRRGTEVDTNLCMDNGELVERPEYELGRTVFVSIPKAGEFAAPPYVGDAMEKSSYRIIDRVWGQLDAILNAEISKLKQRNIKSIYLEPNAVEVADEDFWIGRGSLTATVEISRPRL